ncbi:TPA: hypothetical protein SMO99_002937 [Proteus mirabilis]|nr:MULTISPECIES: hypothetical protein [Providencia]HEJ9425147.1 hypothetical protein [Proteus mirabilis]THB24669.1 hypothetical protein E6R27_16830 [Providencia sp. MGF014]TNU98892.1 hypothetical protein FH869_18370 [Providencia rettgeri]HEJ9454342.1 hypothetical protein [Proteus mirabilis]HEJ9465726.1 hypothetical protein [Proteus mirabilis]
MIIGKFGDVPLGEVRRIVAATADNEGDEWKYISIVFDLGLKTQKHIGKCIEEVLENTEWYGREVIKDMLLADNGLTAKLQRTLELAEAQGEQDLIYKGVEFHSHEKTKYIFSFASKAVSTMYICVITDLDLNPIEVKTIAHGKNYNLDYYLNFQFLNTRYSIDQKYFDELKDSVRWIEGILGKKAQRLNEYLKVIDKYSKKAPGIIDKEQLEMSISLYELNGIRIIHKAFIKKEESIKNQITKVINGVAFKYQFDELKDDKCREFLYELKVAAYLRLSGYEVNVSERADIIIGNEIFVECKKIRSPLKIITRIKEALTQLNKKEKVEKGIIYVDISDAVPGLNDRFLVVNQKDLPELISKKVSPLQHNDKYVKDLITESIFKSTLDYINKHTEDIESLIGDTVLVLNFESAFFHVNPIQERVGLVKIAFVFSNGNSLKYNYIIEDSQRSYSELMKL